MEDHNQMEYINYLEEIRSELEFSYRKKNHLRLILRLYSFMGLLLSVLAILYFVISYYELNLKANQRLSLMVAGVGILLSLMSRFYSDIIKEREKEKEVRRLELNKITQFVLNWATLERTVYSILEKYEKDISRFGIKRNIRLLFDEEIISDREFINLEQALDLRNKIVHGHTSSPPEELEKFSELITEVIDKILIWSKKRHS